MDIHTNTLLFAHRTKLTNFNRSAKMGKTFTVRSRIDAAIRILPIKAVKKSNTFPTNVRVHWFGQKMRHTTLGSTEITIDFPYTIDYTKRIYARAASEGMATPEASKIGRFRKFVTMFRVRKFNKKLSRTIFLS